MDERRALAKRLALAVVEARIVELARPGFYGSLPLELVLQDGIVDLVRLTGVRETIKIDRLPQAA